MENKGYYISKKGNNGEIVYIDYDKLSGFNIKPRNNVKYDGIAVNKMIIIKPSMIQKVLKRKIKNKLNLYLNLIIQMIDDDNGTDGDTLKEALNDLTRYKNIINYKYKKYLDDKYFDLLNKKINLLEYELNMKLQLVNQYEYEEKKTSRRSR